MVVTIMSEKYKKPLGRKNYGHIPHLPGSRMGRGDHKCHEGQARIATSRPRDEHDYITVTEKLDGSNVGVAKKGAEIIALGRAGYRAFTSPYEQHRMFAKWVHQNKKRFDELLKEGERACGEWLAQAHGTRYELPHEPFVVFDIMTDSQRILNEDMRNRCKRVGFITPHMIWQKTSLSIRQAMELLASSFHGAIDPVEGAVWRVERNALIDKHSGKRQWRFDFLVKYVHPNKKDGIYLPEVSGKPPVWNWNMSERFVNDVVRHK